MSGQDIPLGRGDNAPTPMWSVPFDPTGSVFELVVTPHRGVPFTRRSDDGDLVVDGLNRRITWPVASADSAILPLGKLTTYTLRRIVTGGETRYYASGCLIVLAGPVDASLVPIVAVGPQGPPGLPPKTCSVAIVARGQTVIPVPSPPLLLSSVQLEVNGLVFRAPDILASATAVTWANTAFALDPSDVVNLFYV